MYTIYENRCRMLVEQGLALEELNKYENFKDVLGEEDFKEIIRNKKARQTKRCRTKKRFKEIYALKEYLDSRNIENNIVFGTITLNDKYLNLKENTYIRNIHKWLKEHFLYSILNKDFGAKTEREHYHFIGITKEKIVSVSKRSKKGYEIYELEKKNYKMGFEPTLCKIDLKKNDLDKTINYLLKLNNHSSKNTVKSRVRIIKSPLMRLIELRHE